jgi:DNA-binding XRE family transcriptional regulator
MYSHILPVMWVMRHYTAAMNRTPRLIKTLPAPVLNELTQLGLAVRRSRVARNESQNALAQRLGIAERTLRAVEKGDATVSVGVFISALWAVGLGQLSVPITERAARAAASGAKKRARRKALDDF